MVGLLGMIVLVGMDDLLSALYSFPGGYLSDRLGTLWFAWRGRDCTAKAEGV